MKPTLEEICLKLERFWRGKGCLLWQPYPSEVGAGTFNPATFFKVLDQNPWRVCYLEPSRRPRDGRYGQNPFRVQQFWQFQVVLKPAPADVQQLYLRSLLRLGVDPIAHDIRFVEDDWESPTLGAWGLGWQVELDGIEITQFTYFQQMGGLDLPVIPVELTYGLERIAMFLQGVSSIFDVQWDRHHTWGDLYRRCEEEFSRFNFELSDPKAQISQFERLEAEAERLLELGLLYPGYDCVVKCSHLFNLLEARGGISVSERTKYIGRVRRLARLAAELYLKGGDEEVSTRRDWV